MFVHFTDCCIIFHFVKKKLGGLRLTHIEYLHSVHKFFHLFQELKDFSTDKMPYLYSNLT